jgi:hypothetical protein
LGTISGEGRGCSKAIALPVSLKDALLKQADCGTAACSVAKGVRKVFRLKFPGCNLGCRSSVMGILVSDLTHMDSIKALAPQGFRKQR